MQLNEHAVKHSLSLSADMHKSMLILDSDSLQTWLTQMIFNIVLSTHSERQIILCILAIKTSKLNMFVRVVFQTMHVFKRFQGLAKSVHFS